MKIEIIDVEGELLTDFDLESNPFKVGETINIDVKNYDNDFWDVNEIKIDVKINKIEHFIRKQYLRNNRVSMVFCTSVEVSVL